MKTAHAKEAKEAHMRLGLLGMDLSRFTLKNREGGKKEEAPTHDVQQKLDHTIR